MSGGLLTALVASTIGLPASGPLIEGRPDSAVRVVIYEDLQCSDCADFRRMMDEKILPKYGATVAFAHRDFPLAKHAWARRAAIAARYFGEIKPDLDLEWRRQTMARIQETTPANFNEKLTSFARANGIDPARALAALDDKRLAELVENDFQSGVARGIAKTPTVLVNGKPFIEHFTFEDLSQAIDEALAGR
jgi:protein-disulfide isomerase